MSGLRALSFPLAFLLLAPVRAESLDPPCDVAVAPPTTSVTYYVSTGGSDANNGLTESTPWQTLDYAEANATVPGARIALKRGDVFEMATALGIHHGGTASEPIVWDGDFWGTGGRATIRSSQDRDAPEKAVVNIIGASHVVFQNIVVDGNSTNAFGIVVGGTDSYYSADGYQDSETDIIVQGNSILNCGDVDPDPDYYVIAVLIQTWNTDMWNVTIRDNVVDTAANHGIIAYVGRAEHGATPSTLHNMQMYRNTVTNFGINGQSRSSGMGFTQSVVDGVIECNTISQGADSLDGAGVVIAGNEDGTPQNAVVRYNDIRMHNKPGMVIQNGYAPSATVYGNLISQEVALGNAAIWIQIAPGIGYTDGDATAQLVFLHNTIVVGQGTAFTDDSSTPGVTVFRNNLVVNKGSATYGDPCYVANTAASATHDHNACYRPQPGDVYLAIENDGGAVYRSQMSVWEPTAVIEDPLLTDLDGFDWMPALDSPVRQQGVPAGILMDRDGAPYATPPSIGAYEIGVIFSDGFESGDLSSW
jgi:hypothetical protein